VREQSSTSRRAGQIGRSTFHRVAYSLVARHSHGIKKLPDHIPALAPPVVLDDAGKAKPPSPSEQAFVELGDVLLDQMAAVLDGWGRFGGTLYARLSA
jgi:hypothetical protein